LRLIGGSLVPVAVNLQVGGGHSMEITSSTSTVSLQTMFLGAVGVSVPLHTSMVSVEPYVSPGARYRRYLNVAPGAPDHETNFGWVIGANPGSGPLRFHVPHDSEKFTDGTRPGVLAVAASAG